MNSTFSYGRELASNESLSNDCREKVSENVSYLEERWKGLFKQSQDEFARYKIRLQYNYQDKCTFRQNAWIFHFYFPFPQK